MAAKDFLSQLLELAAHLRETAPKSTEDASGWMGSAAHFADLCIVDGRLVPGLATAIPLGAQEQFIKAVKAIKAASGAYNLGLRSNIDNGLGLIVKTLKTEVEVEGGTRFSLQELVQRGGTLPQMQKDIFDATWKHFRGKGEPLTLRTLQPLIGKSPLREVLKGLNGSLIYETQDNDNARCLKITLYGAFLTSHGKIVAGLLLDSLHYLRELYENNHSIAEFTSTAFQEKFGPDNTKLMYRLMRMELPHRFPFSYSGGSGDGSTWNARVGDEVMDLYQADDIGAYLDELLAQRYDEAEPIFYDERMKREWNVGTGETWVDRAMAGTAGFDRTPALAGPTFIDSSRLDELKDLGTGKFDCTRLIAMCEELNYCAERGNAHAVGARAPLLIAITGYKQHDDKVLAQRAGFDHYFAKPYEVSNLLALLEPLVQ